MQYSGLSPEKPGPIQVVPETIKVDAKWWPLLIMVGVVLLATGICAGSFLPGFVGWMCAVLCVMCLFGCIYVVRLMQAKQRRGQRIEDARAERTNAIHALVLEEYGIPKREFFDPVVWAEFFTPDNAVHRKIMAQALFLHEAERLSLKEELEAVSVNPGYAAYAVRIFVKELKLSEDEQLCLVETLLGEFAIKKQVSSN